MTEHKFTDEEIIRALECCVAGRVANCDECPFDKCCTDGTNKMLNNALDLINRQRAEIDWLTSAVNNSTQEFLKLHDTYQEQRAEIERLEEASGRWNDIKMAKPAEADEYLVMIAGAEKPTVLHYDPEEEAFYEEGFDGEAIWYPVTHWAMLPEGPLGTPVATKEAVKRCATCRHEDKMAECDRCVACEKHHLWEAK